MNITIKCRRPAAFTLAELLAVLGIAVLLAALALSARAGAKDQNLVGECAGNLRKYALALQVGANENNDALPVNSGGNWVWDLNWTVGNAIAQYVPPYVPFANSTAGAATNLAWRTFYCPGTGWKFSDSDNLRLWNYAPGSLHVLGYAATFSGTASLSGTNVNPTLTPRPNITAPNAPAPSASQRVLVADATISNAGQSNPSLKATYNWTSIKGGYPIAHTSPHLEGQLPAGGNVAMLDGHVEWRSFSQMLPRTVNPGNPCFWW